MEPQQALARLKEGNERFVANRSELSSAVTPQRRQELVGGQQPFAIVLACADSRVPVEIVFDQGLGELFVCRVAGNVVDPSLAASAEYAAVNLGTPLLVVLGHARCGAVKATLEHVRSGARGDSANLTDLIERVRPAVEEVLGAGGDRADDTLIDEAVRANVHRSLERLRADSPLLHQRETQGQLQMVGAQYDLASGEVRFLDS